MNMSMNYGQVMINIKLKNVSGQILYQPAVMPVGNALYFIANDGVNEELGLLPVPFQPKFIPSQIYTVLGFDLTTEFDGHHCRRRWCKANDGVGNRLGKLSSSSNISI